MSRVRRHPTRIAAWVLTTSAVAFTTWSAFAARAGSDRAIAEQILMVQVSASAANSVPIAQARRALERADRARAAGDVTNAEQLEGLARDWAEYAQDAAKAVQAEHKAASAQSAAADASTRVERARALLEEQMARRARAQGELKALQEASQAATASAPLRAMLTAPVSSGKPAAPKAPTLSPESVEAAP